MLFVLTFLLALGLVPAASPAKNVVELAAATPDLSTLVTALKAGKLTDALSGKGPFTVFAPSNEAFAKLPKSVLERLLDPKNIKELQDLLEYHVIARAAVHKADLKFTQRVKTLEGKELFIVKDHRGDVLVDNARVTTADVDASNGVVHIIDNVLIPRALDQSASPAVTKNIVELAAATADLSTLVTALKAGKLTDALSGKGPFTVFAPSNEAFAKLPKSVLERLLDPKNIKELQAVLEYHVIAGAAVHKADLKFTQRVKTLEGKELVIVKDHRGDVLVDNARVTTADVDASNGVVHIIDNVLIPRALDQSASPAVTKNIVELAAATADLSTLVTALKAGKLTDALSGKGPFTVFAPSNEAFAKLPKSVLERLLDPKNIKELQAVLEYHVIAGAAVHKADLKFTQRVKTLEGKELFIVKDHRGDVLVDNARVTTADVDASNGVVHIIDNVLIPRALDQSASPAVTKNIVELAAATADLSTLVTALKAGKLTDALSGKGPFTVFAPSNEAFSKLPKSVLERLLDPKNIKELQNLLEYHVIAGAAVHKADLKFIQKVKTLEGKELFIVKDHRGDVLVDNARVTTADVDASNGVVHIIDKVLIPRALDQLPPAAVTPQAQSPTATAFLVVV